LLSEWISADIDYQRLNDLTFKAFLWLPPELAIGLSDSLSHKADAPDVRVLLKEVRVHLQGEDDELQSSQIIIFNDPNKKV